MGCEAQMGFPREGGVVLGGISVLTEGTRGPKSAGLVRRPQRGEMEWFCSKMAPPGFRAAPSPWKSLKTKKPQKTPQTPPPKTPNSPKKPQKTSQKPPTPQENPKDSPKTTPKDPPKTPKDPPKNPEDPPKPPK